MFKQFGKSDAPAKNSDNVVELDAAAQVASTALRSLTKTDKELKDRLDLKSRLHEALLERLNLSVIDKVATDELRREVANLVQVVLAEEKRPMRTEDFKIIVDELMDEVLGYGPLEPLLADPTINDILVNAHDKIYVERFGVLERTTIRFRDERHLLRIIDKIVSSIGRRVDESQPWVDARLPDGSRVNAIIRPCAIDGPSLSIRKFSKKPILLEKMIELNSVSEEAAGLLRALV
ncbi:MAG: ATPase, T2SS/T4P/T4SS family, partial [Boseongicola sp.]